MKINESFGVIFSYVFFGQILMRIDVAKLYLGKNYKINFYENKR